MKNKERSKFWARMRHTYRLIVRNDETFEEVGSFKLTLLNLYITLSSLIVLVSIITICIIVYTPVKRFIPGYGDIRGNTEFIRLNRKITQMEEELARQSLYSESFRKILTADVETTPELTEPELVPPDSFIRGERIFEDELLRRDVEQEENLREIQEYKGEEKFNIAIPLEQLFLVPPVSGELSAGFALDKQHFGVDIMAPKNTPVKSVLDGFVIMSDWSLKTGNTVGIQHENDLVSFYKHNSMLLKREGSYVKAGEAVAIIGNTGTKSDGPHLHFELWHNGKPVDPSKYINFN